MPPHKTTTLWEAACEEDLESLSLILADDGRKYVDERDDYGRTALHCAASAG